MCYLAPVEPSKETLTSRLDLKKMSIVSIGVNDGRMAVTLPCLYRIPSVDTTLFAATQLQEAMGAFIVLLLQCIILSLLIVANDAIAEGAKSFARSTILPEFTRLAEWIRSHEGGLVDERLVVRGIPVENSTASSATYRGVFTTGDIRPREHLLFIPWSTIIGPGHFRQDSDAPLADTVFNLAHELEHLDSSPYAPYLKVIQAQHITVPSSWSLSGRYLLQQMIGPILPPQSVERNVESFLQDHDMHPHVLQSYYSVVTRAMQANSGMEWWLVPLVDQHNHQSDDALVNTIRYASRGKGFEVFSTKFIPAGSELYTNYWGDYTSFFYEEFGFVEHYPQRWKFDFRRVGGAELDVRLSVRRNTTAATTNTPEEDPFFELDWFTDTPDEVSLNIMKKEVARLQAFEQEKHHDEDSRNGLISKSEWDLIWDYHRALSTTLQQILVASTNDKDTSQQGECIPGEMAGNACLSYGHESYY